MLPPPCKDCPVIPVCRRKLFKHLISQCSILKLYLYRRMDPPLGYYTSFPRRNHPDLYKRHISLLVALKPKEWYVLNSIDSNHDEATIIVASEDRADWNKGFAGTVQHTVAATYIKKRG